MKVGIDIEEVERFIKYIKNKIYLQRLFAKEEISYVMSSNQCKTIERLATYFSAKEAVWKAINSSYKTLLISDIVIKHDKNGKPKVYVKNQYCKNIDISLSHTKKYVVAVAIAF
ncbi:MAG: 4'-phosphopantetheinyl transferase superfamily protein [Endomicrobium sp.]|jgi:holo-[acyl-carrier protein] synthase|nr:4'-phosphopantetheinyl transferase superfamily protein [Endomicrobium sp.]